MSDRVTIRSVGGGPVQRQWDDEGVHLPTAAAPMPTTLDEADLKRQRELADENQRWNHAIGHGITQRDQFIQQWIHKHADE